MDINDANYISDNDIQVRSLIGCLWCCRCLCKEKKHVYAQVIFDGLSLCLECFKELPWMKKNILEK